MSTADELFRLTGSDEPHIVINSDRSITVPSELKNIAVQYDHNIETVTFDCPRYWDETDMSEMLVSINYSLSNGFEDTYICPSVTIDDTDNSIIHFTWTISNKVTQAIGAIEFVVCLKLLDDEEIASRIWHSQTCSELNVLKGKECDARIISEYEEGVRSVQNPLKYVQSLSGLYKNTNASFPGRYELIIEAPIATDFSYLLSSNSQIGSVVLKGNDTNTPLNFTCAFENAVNLTCLDAEQMPLKILNADRAFYNDTCLEEIKGQLDLSAVQSANNAFYQCVKLREIRFKPNTLAAPAFAMTGTPKLSIESLQSIIDGLMPALSTSLATLYLHSTAASKLTEEQILQLTNKNWTVQ